MYIKSEDKLTRIPVQNSILSITFICSVSNKLLISAPRDIHTLHESITPSKSDLISCFSVASCLISIMKYKQQQKQQHQQTTAEKAETFSIFRIKQYYKTYT
ncbi:hypothetical protein O3G_MSEX000563 [Manduca sexta]|nr:hypothetical protein O3G_MSEX000563 [Manduca sexta]